MSDGDEFVWYEDPVVRTVGVATLIGLLMQAFAPLYPSQTYTTDTLRRYWKVTERFAENRRLCFPLIIDLVMVYYHNINEISYISILPNELVINHR